MTALEVDHKKRREDKVNFDYTINITNIIALVILIGTIISYGNQAVNYLKSINAKTNIMWTHFDKTNMTKEEQLTIELSHQ